MKQSVSSMRTRACFRSSAQRKFALGAALLPFVAPLAHGQETTSIELEEIVITGSRIRGVAPVGSSMISFDREAIDVSPSLTTVDLLREAPQVVNLGADASHRGVQGGQANTRMASGINLRGIGPNATLLLVDGNRMPLSGNLVHFVDPSVIPTIALERLEVVADGASAVYGSDAVAGVVNMILRDGFEGAETAVRYGEADGYEKRQVSQIFGLGGESGNVMVAYENTFNGNLMGYERDWYTSDQTARGGSDYRSENCAPGTLIVGGVSYALPAGDGTAVDPSQLVAGTANRCDDIRNTDLLPRSNRHSAALKASQRLNDRMKLNAQGFYSEREFRMYGLLDNSRERASLVVPNTNAFFVSPNPAATSVTVNYLFPEAFGRSTQEGVSKSYLSVLDLTADVFDSWQVVVKGSYGESQDLNDAKNSIIQSELTAALASSDPATAFNPFGDGSSINPAVLNRIRGTTASDIRHRLVTGSVEANGTLVELPAGNLALAIGAEHREERYGFETLNTNGSITADAFDREIDSAYAELFVPMLKGARFADRLDASLAVRYDKYSDAGSTTNPKIGINWGPVPGMTLKASYGTSFRAPSLSETNAFPQIFQRVLADPLSPTGQSTGISIAGGNPNVEPEEAETWSFGFEWEPEAIAGLRLNLSYFAVEYTGQILDLHGVPSRLADPAYANYVIRNPTQDQIQEVLNRGYQISGVVNPAVVTFIVDGRRQNLGVTEAQGIDFQSLYNWHSDGGHRFAFALSGSYFTKFDIAASDIAPKLNVLNTIDNPLRFRTRATVMWDYNGFNASAMFNYSSSYTNNLVAVPHEISSWKTLDLNLGYSFKGEGFLDGLSVGLAIENALDKEPPFVDRSEGFDPQVSSAIGRLVSLSVRKRW